MLSETRDIADCVDRAANQYRSNCESRDDRVNDVYFLGRLPMGRANEIWGNIDRFDGIRRHIVGIREHLESYLIWLCSYQDFLEAIGKRIEDMERVA
jgi:hypothetical protein